MVIADMQEDLKIKKFVCDVMHQLNLYCHYLIYKDVFYIFLMHSSVVFDVALHICIRPSL